MKTKITMLLMLFVLLTAYPFGCKVRKHKSLKKQRISTARDLKTAVKESLKTDNIEDITRKFSEEKSKTNSKVTYRETTTVKKLDLKTEYVLDSIQPEDGSLNFTAKDGAKLNVQKNGNLLQLTQKESNTNTVAIQNVRELIVENIKEKSQVSVDSSVIKRAQYERYLDSLTKAKEREDKELLDKAKEVKQEPLSWWKVGAVAGFAVLMWLVWGYFGKK